MTNANATLDDLREEIDEIDGAIHELLMRRAVLAERIGGIKDDSARDGATGAAAYLRPGREAAVLRRLVQRHSGSFPLPSLVRLWREIMSSLLRLQGPFSVAVLSVADNPGFWDVARDHYGSTTPMTPCQSPIQVLREVAEGRATVGVLPFPEEGEAAPWWPLVASTRTNQLGVISRLPFVASPNASAAGSRAQVSAVAIGCVAPEETGDDRSLLTLEIAEELSRARLTHALASIGLPALLQVAAPSHGGQPGGLYLIETDGFVTAEDPRLAKLADTLGSALSRVTVLGAYPAPIISMEEPARKLGAAGAGRS